jgi:hypothetical protein
MIIFAAIFDIELQNYFTKVLEDNLKTTMKPQYVDHIPKAVSGTVIDILIGVVRFRFFFWLICCDFCVCLGWRYLEAQRRS